MEKQTPKPSNRLSSARVEAAVLFLAFTSLFSYSLVKHISLPDGTAFFLSPYLFPGLAGLAGIVASAFSIAKNAPAAHEAAASDASAGCRAWFTMLAVAGLSFLLYIGIQYIGFLPSAALYLCACALLFGERRALALVLFSTLTSAALWALFRFAFGVLI